MSGDVGPPVAPPLQVAVPRAPSQLSTLSPDAIANVCMTRASGELVAAVVHQDPLINATTRAIFGSVVVLAGDSMVNHSAGVAVRAHAVARDAEGNLELSELTRATGVVLSVELN